MLLPRLMNVASIVLAVALGAMADCNLKWTVDPVGENSDAQVKAEGFNFRVSVFNYGSKAIFSTFQLGGKSECGELGKCHFGVSDSLQVILLGKSGDIIGEVDIPFGVDAEIDSVNVFRILLRTKPMAVKRLKSAIVRYRYSELQIAVGSIALPERKNYSSCFVDQNIKW